VPPTSSIVPFICAVVFYTLPCREGCIKATWKCEVPFITQQADSEATSPSLAGQYMPLTWSHICQTPSGSIPTPCGQGIQYPPPTQLHHLPWECWAPGPAALIFRAASASQSQAFQTPHTHTEKPQRGIVKEGRPTQHICSTFLFGLKDFVNRV